MQQRLKLYSYCSKNELVMYYGTVVANDGKERRVNIDFEPFKSINTSLYLCDNKFYMEDLNELFVNDEAFGFIMMDGNGCLCGSMRGSGGQLALRFARLLLEKPHNYVRKVAELVTQMFILDGQRLNVQGLVLAGSVDFKLELMRSDLFDKRFANVVIKMMDMSCGRRTGSTRPLSCPWIPWAPSSS